MKKTLLTGLLLFIAIELFSESSNIAILRNQKVAGRISALQKDISAKEYVFPERIHEFYIDTISHYLTVQLRGVSKNGKWLDNTGSLVLYDLNSDSVKWTRKMNYQTSSIHQYASTIIYSTANKCYCLNIENGENLWEVKNNIYYVNPRHRIGVGYKFSSFNGSTNKLEGIDLNTGNVIWQKELNRDYGWNDVFCHNDSDLLIVAGGLHDININNGEGWDYNAITGKKDYKGTVAANAVGIAIGALTGVGIATIGYDLVRDVVSNVLSDSTSFYFASKENVARIDKKNGKVVWSSPVPKDSSSKSSIFIKDSILYMINGGYAYMGYRQINFGVPFIASFNKDSGKERFFSKISEKKDPILGSQIKGDTLLLVFKNRVSAYSLSNGSKILEKEFDATECGELKYFTGSQLYTSSNDSTFTSLILSDASKNYLYTGKGKILVLDKGLNICGQLDLEQLYINYLNTKDYQFMVKGNSTTILDKKCHRIANADVSKNAFMIGNKLYDVQEKTLLEIDLSELTNK